MKKLLEGPAPVPACFAIAKVDERPFLSKHGLQLAVLSGLIGLALTGVARASDLTDLLQHTLDNPGIAASELQSQAAAEDVSAANLRYLGQANVFAGRYSYNTPRVIGVFTPGVTALPVPSSGDITQSGINYRLPVDVFGVIAAERKQAQAGSEIAQLLARQETLLRLHQSLAAYVRLQALAAQSEALRAEQKQLDVYANQVREEVKLGRTARLDLSLVQSELARLASQQMIFEGNQRAALAELKASANVTDPSISGTIVVPTLQNADGQASLPIALAREQQTLADEAAQKARRSLLPSFGVDGQYASYDGSGIQRNVWTVGIDMSIPLDPAAMKSASASMLRARAAQEQSLAVQRDTLAQISTLEASYWAAVGNANALAAEVAHRQDVTTVERGKWQLGAGTMDELLYQERNLLDAQYALADSRAQGATAWSGMQILLGIPSAQYINLLEAKP
jgi:outer membrane protein TolC